MAKIINLRWTKLDKYYESNLVKVNGIAYIQVQFDNQRDVDISYLLSLSGDRFVSISQDYFANLHIRPIPIKGVGQIVKFRINKLPDYAIVMGDDLDDAGDVNPEDPEDITNGFAGSEGEYFRCINSEIFVGRNF